MFLERMSNYKIPRRVEIVDALPVNASGKVLKYEVTRAAGQHGLTEEERAMGKFLRLGEDPQGERWALPDEADLEALRAELAGAMTEGTAVPVAVQLDERRTGTLLVNGRAVPFVLLWEEGGQKPSFTLID